jgi:glycosyltransferase involved in cell wall biosynthesis
MRVLMTADAVGGVWTYALELARALEPRGVRIVLAVLGPAPSHAQRRELMALPHVTLAEHAGRLEWMDDAWDDVAEAGQWLLDLERATAPDVVHLNGFTHAVLPWRAPTVVVGHSCVLSWWQEVLAEDAPPRYTEYARRVAAGIAAARLVVAPSAAMLAMLDAHYGPLKHARVIHNGRAPLLPDAVSIEKEPIILAAGRLWDDAKNVQAVVRAAPRMPWPVVTAGDCCAPEGQDAAALDGVRHLGRLTEPELAIWMARASVFVSPARYEPFGLSILEAALSGCALVLGDIRTLREIWGDAALYVPPDDEDRLVDTVWSLLGDSDRRCLYATAARHRARQFSPRRMADAYWKAYADVGCMMRTPLEVA